jgi:hypothetical protein
MSRSKNTRRNNISCPNAPACRDSSPNPLNDSRGSGRQTVLSPEQSLAADPHGKFTRTIRIVPRLFSPNNRD